jgi:Spy/CpxP family protein refolding chaperone
LRLCEIVYIADVAENNLKNFRRSFMKKSLVISSLAILLTLSIAAMTVWADAGLSSGKRGKGSFREIAQIAFAIVDELRGLAKDVALTTPQKAAVKAILTNAKPTAQEFRQQFRAKHKELREALLSANPDQSRVQSLQQEIANLTAQMTLFRLQTVEQVTALLTPAQKQIALEDLAKIDPLIDELKEEIENAVMNSQK